MGRPALLRSVVTRLVVCLVLGGLVASAGLAMLEVNRGEPALRMELTQRVLLATRNLQTALRGQLPGATDRAVRQSLEVFTAGAPVTAARVVKPGGGAVVVGPWPAQPVATDWLLGEYAATTGTEVELHRATLVRAPFEHEGKDYAVELLIDGPSAQANLRQDEFDRLLMQWLLMAVLMLLGLLMLRRLVLAPLGDIVRQVRGGAAGEAFHRFARGCSGEFGQLAAAIGGMLDRIETTAAALRQREAAFQSLYQHAPAAMLSVDGKGVIVEANQRAAQLLGLQRADELVGAHALDLVRPEDRATLRLTIDRLELDASARCELQLLVGEGAIDAVCECVGVRDEDGNLRHVRLSLLDVSEAKRLHRQLVEQTQLLNLVIDHMSDAILLVDKRGRIAAFNQRLVGLLHVSPSSLRGKTYETDTFWDDLGPLHPSLFVSRLRQIEADDTRPAQERVETRVGTFVFQGIPVADASQNAVGRLWVVQETTPQEQNQRLLLQQSSQLHALKRLGHELLKLDDTDAVVEKAVGELYTMFGVEAMGLALRGEHLAQRCTQVIHRGSGAYLLQPNQELVTAIAEKLMRQVLNQSEVMFWPEMPKSMEWSKAFMMAGLTCLAAAPLRGSQETMGMIWIARRGGERLESQHIYLLETLAPVIAARLDVARLSHRLRQVELTDPTTELPTTEPFHRAALRQANRPGQPWSVAVIRLEHFRELNQTLSHATADRMLRQAAQVIVNSCRRVCTVARLEGVDFAVLAPGHDRAGAVHMVNRLRQRIAEVGATLPDGGTIHLASSIGVACSPADGVGADELIALAHARARRARLIAPNSVVAEGEASSDRVAG